MTARGEHVVLGYGALLDEASVRSLCGEGLLRFDVAVLRGWRREWNAPYRNGCWDEGRYVSGDDGAAPEGVVFLGVRPVSAAAIAECAAVPGAAQEASVEEDEGGLLVSVLTVTREARGRIDAEEYLYVRVPVPGSLMGSFAAVPELYVPAPRQYPEGWYRGENCVVSRAYRDKVVAAERRLLATRDGSFATVPESPWPVRGLRWTAGADPLAT